MEEFPYKLTTGSPITSLQYNTPMIPSLGDFNPPKWDITIPGLPPTTIANINSQVESFNEWLQNHPVGGTTSDSDKNTSKNKEVYFNDLFDDGTASSSNTQSTEISGTNSSVSNSYTSDATTSGYSNNVPNFEQDIITSFESDKKKKGAGNTEVIINTLVDELMALEGIHGQNPETGAGSDKSYLSEYTTRLFGAPFQLLNSVDERFDKVNPSVGNEYLRNFLLNSPILYIRPGMPKYTGGDNPKSLKTLIQNVYVDTTFGGTGVIESLLDSMVQNTFFGIGAKLQRRMFGFRETYYDYMQHVNYMCRSMAVFLNLTSVDEGVEYPNGAFVSGETEQFEDFANMKWQNYRMLRHQNVIDPWDYLKQLASPTFLGAVWETGKQTLGGILDVASSLMSGEGIIDSIVGAWNSRTNGIQEAWNNAANNTGVGVMVDKISSVQFMVEPVSFTENLTNQTAESAIEASIDAIRGGIGAEVAFITNSDADLGMVGEVVEFLGNTAESAAEFMNGITEIATGGFLSNLFSGAIRSIKNQKMIYPEIYKESKSEMNYQYNITLTTPYGDIYNYYMNIIVPLMHLIALAAPRLVSSNSTTSPYMIQSYIPGQATCQLGIISTMTITKNPDGNHVSVNGFPLTVKVDFTIKELYNALSISPANDPASFLFNETLNDYMSNLAGLIPSIDTYTKQRRTMFENLDKYLDPRNGAFLNDTAQIWVEKYENLINPFAGR